MADITTNNLNIDYRRYGDAIRKIAGTDEKKDTLGQATDKATIEGQRGIGYYQGTTVTSGSGRPGQTQAPTPTNPTNQKTSEALAQDNIDKNAGQKNNNTDPTAGGNVKSSTDGVHDTTALIDENVDSYISGIPGITGGVLNGLTGLVDPISGKNVSIRFDGAYIGPVDPAWLEAQTPPVDTTWILGKQVQDSADGTIHVSGSAWLYNYVAGGVYMPNPSITDATLVVLTPNVLFGINSVIGGGTVRGTGSLVNCTAGSSVQCPLEAPALQFWPAETTDFQLALQSGGSFVPSVYDKNSPSFYRQPSSTLNLNFGVGALRNLVVESNNIGGKNVFESSEASGPPIGPVRVYNSARELVTFTDSTGIAQYKL